MEQLLIKKKEIVSQLLRQNILVSQDIIQKLQQPSIVELWHEQLMNGTPYSQLNQQKKEPTQNNQNISEPTVEIIKTYSQQASKRSIQDFILHYNNRFKQISKILQPRAELQALTSITRTLQKHDKEKVSIIGYVVDKQTTKNNNIILTIEDDTGRTKAIVNNSKPELMTQAKDLTFDEIIGITGTNADNAIFADTITIPDIPLTHELKKGDEDAHAAIISDVHIGSKFFMEKEFTRFLNWTKSEEGSAAQREQAAKTKYILILGDLVDGVGIYPGQEKELTIKDIYMQYEKFAGYIQQIPKDKQIVIIPGNHDIGRISEPQPRISKEYAKSVCQMPNVINLSNPSTIRIHTTRNSPGFDILMYHGYSYDFYGDTVESIRASAKNISQRVGGIMKFLLKRRHLAPTHGSTLYIPDKKEDPLVIDQVPDFFISGHIHKVNTETYRGVSLISSGCWQSMTPFQEKVGHEPEPGKVPLINLKTRGITLLDFNQ